MLEDINASTYNRHLCHSMTVQIFSRDIRTVRDKNVEGLHCVSLDCTQKRCHVVPICNICPGLHVTETLLLYHVFQDLTN